MRDPYTTSHNAPTARGDGFTLKERNQLGEYRQRGLIRFRDVNAFFCKACRQVFGVYCPNCKVRSNPTHASDGDAVFTDMSLSDSWDGFDWRLIKCLKCDYLLRVIIR